MGVGDPQRYSRPLPPPTPSFLIKYDLVHNNSLQYVELWGKLRYFFSHKESLIHTYSGFTYT